MQWWYGLEVRERLVLSIAVLVVSVILLDTLVLQPLQHRRSQLEDNLAQAQDDLEWMRLAILRLPASNDKKKKVLAGRIVTFLDQQISRHGLKQNMQQMTPIQNQSARLRLSDVEFGKLMQFFSAISGAVVIEEVRILPADQPGLVNVSLVLRNGSANGQGQR